jgi:Activator of Hsp90 ATPase homolog 1-like protein
MSDDIVTVSIEVNADPDTAFHVFTSEIDSWWLRGPMHRFRPRGNGKLTFEPGLSGRLFEQYDDGSVFVIGRVTRWEPGQCVALSWRLPNFKDAESTEVEVSFEPIGDATRVSVAHRGWDRLRAGHPARHGMQGHELEMEKAQLWGANLASLRRWINSNDGRKHK